MSEKAVVLALNSPQFPPHLKQRAIGLAANAPGNLGHEIKGDVRRGLFRPGLRPSQIMVALLGDEIAGMASFKWRGPGPVKPSLTDFIRALGVSVGLGYWLYFSYIQQRIGRDGLYIVGIDVFDGYNRRGVGSALMQSLIAIARELGADAVETDVREGNDSAHAFYRGQGFTPPVYPLWSLGRLIAATNGVYRRVRLPLDAPPR